MMKSSDRQPALNAFKLARQRERAASDKIGQALVDSFITEVSQDTWILFPWDTEPQFVAPIARTAASGAA